LELWLFIMGSLVYWTLYLVVSLAPQAPYFPANPSGLFAPLTAWFFVRSREKRAYWVTVVIAFLAATYPAWSPSWMTLFGEPRAMFLALIFVPPALLLGLMLSPRVRRNARSAPDPQGISSATLPPG
jgi:hypothetical protein